MPNSILVIIPAHNEEASIANVIIGIRRLDLPLDILVINDGSHDATPDIAEEYGAAVLTHTFNMGYGAALQTGYKFACMKKYEYVVQMDADGQHDPSNITNIIQQFEKDDNVDIVLGSRFLSETPYCLSLTKKVAVGVFRLIIKMLTKQYITDPTSGLQGLSKRAFSFYARFANFSYDYPDANMIVQMILKHYMVREIPAVMYHRSTGASMHSGIKPVLYMIKMFLSILIILLRERFGDQKCEIMHEGEIK